MMQKTTFLLVFTFVCAALGAQQSLPRALSSSEKEQLRQYNSPALLSVRVDDQVYDTRPISSVRSMAEWEEIQAIVVSWTAFKSELSEIIKHAQKSCKVIVQCNNCQFAQVELENTFGVTLSNNVIFLQNEFNSIWVRDYGANTAYTQPGDSLVLVDWIYNRPRPMDDTSALEIARFLELPLYTTVRNPDDLVNTGGNFMSDGAGIGFSSELVLEENDMFNPYGVSAKTENEINDIMSAYLGVENYIKMPTLTYDGIHHIDMHMKVLDERTLLIGQFPDGVSDGPRIDQNINYIQNNYKAANGKKFIIERIIQPPCANGNYPPGCQSPYEYRTYTNALFINNLILVPIYDNQYDEQALETWRRLKPGHEVIGVNCEDVINLGGAIHCITKEIGVTDPLHIQHFRLDTACKNEDLVFEAKITHRSGIEKAELHYDDGLGYKTLVMQQGAGGEWTADLPGFSQEATIKYYITAKANSAKEISRPMAAPQSYFSFKVGSCNVVNTNDPLVAKGWSMTLPSPNPVFSNASVTVNSPQATAIAIQVNVYNMLGERVRTIGNTEVSSGETRFNIDMNGLPAAMYQISLHTADGSISHKIIKQ